MILCYAIVKHISYAYFNTKALLPLFAFGNGTFVFCFSRFVSIYPGT